MRWARLTQAPGWGRWPSWALGIGGSVAVAASWIPVRDRLPDVDVALLLVAVVTLAGLGGRRAPVAAAAVVAALAFDAFDTAPYGTLAIAGARDLVTTLVLALAGIGGGELAVRLGRTHLAPWAGTDGFSRVRDAAALAAEGGETALVVGAVAEEVRRLLGLRDCRYEAGVPAASMEVTRQGLLRSLRPERTAALLSPTPVPPWDQVALPVWGQGRRIGTFLLVLVPGVPLDPHRLVVAVTLADQAGAALAAFLPPPSDPPVPPAAAHLRLLR